MSITFHNYGFSRDNINSINALAVRVRTIDATVASDMFGFTRGVNRVVCAAMDKMAAAVATSDSQKPNFIFGNHWHTGRSLAAALILLEARVTALGR